MTLFPFFLSGAYDDPFTREPSGPDTFEATTPLSPATTSNSTRSPSPTDLTAFPGLFLAMTVRWTNKSSFVSSLMMNPYPDLALNHLTVPVTHISCRNSLFFRVVPFNSALGERSSSVDGSLCWGIRSDNSSQALSGETRKFSRVS